MPVAEAPSAAPSTETFSTPANLNDAFSSLGSLFPQAEEPAAPEAPPEPQKAPQTRPEPKTEPKAPPVKPEAPKPEIKPPEVKQEQRPVKAKTLAEAKDMANERAKKFEAEANDWRSKYEQLSKAPKDDPEKKTLAERLEAREKRLAEMEQTLKYKAYEESDEYKQKYHEPFVSAYQEGRDFVSQLEVVEKTITNSETGEVRVVQPSRQATQADFDELMALYYKSPAEGARKANQLFGDMAADVKIKMGEAQKLLKASEKAKEHYRKEGSTIEKQRQEQTVAQQREAASAWEAENKAATDKYPQWFGPQDGDEKGNALLEKGTDLAARIFDGRAEQLPPKERARLHSAIFNKARGFDRLAYQHATLTKEHQALKEKLAQYEDSEPSGGEKRRQATEEKPDNIESVISSLDRLVKPLR